jgi:integrase
MNRSPHFSAYAETGLDASFCLVLRRLLVTPYACDGIFLDPPVHTAAPNRLKTFNSHSSRSKSIGTARARAYTELKIEEFHFDDLHHESTSRLFEAGLTIEKVAVMTGHTDWRILKR